MRLQYLTDAFVMARAGSEAIDCSPLDAGQVIERRDRPIADFRHTELSAN